MAITRVMGISTNVCATILRLKRILHLQSLSHHSSVVSLGTRRVAPRGHFAVYSGDGCGKRVILPISYLKHDVFQELLRLAEAEFGFHQPMHGLTIPCSVDAFSIIISRLNSCKSGFDNLSYSLRGALDLEIGITQSP